MWNPLQHIKQQANLPGATNFANSIIGKLFSPASPSGKGNTTMQTGRGYTTPAPSTVNNAVRNTNVTANPGWVNTAAYVMRNPSSNMRTPWTQPTPASSHGNPAKTEFLTHQGYSSDPVPTNRNGSAVKPNTPVGADNQFTFTSTLKSGSKGDEVKALQSMLGINADGIFGPQTKNAVIAFQKANGLTPDGIVGRNTIAALTGNPVVPGPVSSGSGGSSGSGVTSVGSGGSGVTTGTEGATGGITGDFVGQVTPNMPEFNFDYEQQSVPELEELIALAAQQLDPHYAMIGEQAGKTNDKMLQGIENDSIRRGMGRSTDLGNRSDEQNKGYQEMLMNLERQKEMDKMSMAKSEQEKAQQLSRQDYQDKYSRAVDDYARQMQMWQTEHGMDMDKQTMDLKRQEVKNMLTRTSSGGSSGSSSGSTGSGIKLAGDRTTFNRALENATSVYDDFMNGTISRQDALDYANNTLRQVQSGAYNSDLGTSLEELIKNFMKEIGSSINSHEQRSRDQRRNS